MPDLTYLTKLDPVRFELKPGQESMKAMVTTGNGDYDQLDYRDVRIPQIGRGEVLLKVLAAGVNNTEINTRLGWYSSSVDSGTDQFSDSDIESTSAQLADLLSRINNSHYFFKKAASTDATLQSCCQEKPTYR